MMGETTMVDHDSGFSHASALQCDLCPGYPHRDCARRAERDALAATVARVVVLHQETAEQGNTYPPRGYCKTCGIRWPCATIAALDGPGE